MRTRTSSPANRSNITLTTPYSSSRGFTYLSLPTLEAAVADETQTQLKHLVQQLPSSEVYDQNNNYLPEVTERAYLQALELVLEHAADYYTTEEISLALNYTDGRWQLIMNNSLLKALNGGAGY